MARRIFFIFIAITILNPTVFSQSQERYVIDVISLPIGYGVYDLGVGLADVINKNSKWIKANHFEGKEPTVTMRLLIAEPEKKKRTIFFSDSWSNWAGMAQLGVLKGIQYDYTKFKGLFLISVGPNVLATLNPKIKTLEDLRGKRVVLSSTPGGVVDLIFKGIFKEAGVEGDIKYQYLKPGEAVNAIKDGLVDVIQGGVSLRQPPDVYGPAPALVDLASTRDTYFVKVPEKYIKTFAEKNRCNVTPVKIPPKQLGPLQLEPLETIAKSLFWAVHLEVPDNVVSEVIKIVYENTEKFKDYNPTGKILTKSTMALMGLKEYEIHPAALKFYKENRIPIGSFGKE